MDEFVNRINRLDEVRLRQERLSSRLSLARLFVLIIGAAACIYVFKGGNYQYGVMLALIFFIIFITAVAIHNNVKGKLKRTEAAIRVNRNYIDRKGEVWTEFKDNGKDFVNPDHRYSSDLDVFGPKSLFQWLNVSYTYHGRKKLKELFEDPEKDIGTIRMRQRATKEMAEKLDFSQELQCEGMLNEGIKEDPKDLIAYAEDPIKLFKKKWMENVFYLLPFTTILTLALYIMKFNISVYVPFGLIVIQIVVMAVGYIKVMPVLNTVYKFKSNIEAYKNIFKLIEKEEFKDPLLSELKSGLFVKDKPASSRINSLEKIVDAIDLRYNPIMYFVLNITLLWDYHCLFALEEWKKNNGSSIRRWVNNVGYIEAISSLSVVLLINSDWSFPDFEQDDMLFAASFLGHPLIRRDKRVNNDIRINGNLCIVTGSNMSGKTTLLRTIGVNLVLAYAGAPVCSEKLSCSVMDIFTSMRISDDLNSGISTFYAELLRIKLIIEYSKKKHPMIFLIDELFRGTNSRDRVTGARSLLRNLSREWVIGLISTHDFELCDLEYENSKAVINYHFTESYANNKIRFDYKLRQGRCSTTNAKYLMRMVGIELLDGE